MPTVNEVILRHNQVPPPVRPRCMLVPEDGTRSNFVNWREKTEVTYFDLHNSSHKLGLSLLYTLLSFWCNIYVIPKQPDYVNVRILGALWDFFGILLNIITYFLQLCNIECIIFNVIAQAFKQFTRVVIYLLTYFENINDMWHYSAEICIRDCTPFHLLNINVSNQNKRISNSVFYVLFFEHS